MNKRQRGYILLLTVLVIGVLMIVSISYMNYYLQDKALAQKAELETVAESAADAGIDYAVSRLNLKDPLFTNITQITTITNALSHSGATYTLTFIPTPPPAATPAPTPTPLPAGTAPYSMNNVNGTEAINTGWPGNRYVPAHAVHIVSVGKFQGVTKIEEAMLTTQEVTLFPGSAAVQTTISISASSGKNSIAVNSYNSDNGPYGGANKFNNGNLFSNAGFGQNVSLAGQYAIDIKNSNAYGNATYVSSNPSLGINVGKSGYLSGTQSTSTSPMQFPPVNIPQNATDLGTIDLSGKQKLELTAGGNYVCNSISMSGSSTIQLKNVNYKIDPPGPVKLYVKGDITIGGTTEVNSPSSQIPPNFLVYAVGGNLTFNAGTPKIYWGFYGPNASVRVSGNPEIFGAISSKDLTGNGSITIHYDEILKTAGTSGVTGTVTYRARW